MALTNEAKIHILNRALGLEARSFLEYLAQTAPPVDLGKHPSVQRAFHLIAKEEDEIVDELAEAIEALGVHAEPIGSYDLTFTSYNYITTSYALKVIEERLAKNFRAFDALVVEAKADPALEAQLAAIRARKTEHLGEIQRMRATLPGLDAGKSGPAAVAASHAAPPASAKAPAAAPTAPKPPPVPGHTAH